MPRGGPRPGAGRPVGTKNLFPKGFIQMTRNETMNGKLKIPGVPKGHRVPPEATAEEREAADYAFQRYIDVASGRVPAHKAPAVLKGAMEIRKEICGPIAQKVDVDVKGRLEHLLTRSLETEEMKTLPPASDPPAGT